MLSVIWYEAVCFALHYVFLWSRKFYLVYCIVFDSRAAVWNGSGCHYSCSLLCYCCHIGLECAHRCSYAALPQAIQHQPRAWPTRLTQGSYPLTWFTIGSIREPVHWHLSTTVSAVHGYINRTVLWYSVVFQYNSAQWYEHYLLTGCSTDWTLILLGLFLCLPSTCVSFLKFMVLYILKNW